MRVGLATIQRGRQEHLVRQARAILDQTLPPDRYVVLSMDPSADDTERALEIALGPETAGVDVVAAPAETPSRLPLAATRNRAMRALDDVDLVILLDIDCIPGHTLVERYVDGHLAAPTAHRLLAGPVGYLPPGRPRGLLLRAADRTEAAPARGRPVPTDGHLVDEPRHELFWSLSFAVRPSVHDIIGGFDEDFVGYGGEDTDYALRARRAGVDLTWVGGAWAYHQHHPVSHPPREHLADIVRNARLFRQRWGRWPMEGWLRTFADEGTIDWDPDGDELRLREPG